MSKKEKLVIRLKALIGKIEIGLFCIDDNPDTIAVDELRDELDAITEDLEN